jgi:2-succinyl-5-enolpyruvyl-6-hydroxy-3-cyclohexene-1-carboxylate synthase
VSVPIQADVQATFAATLVDEWIRAGVRDAVIAPGSRSTPVVAALANRPEIVLHVRIDERSAGFFAIGRSLASARPTIVVVTSGTAAAELHPSVCEADLARVPIVFVTADRPPELHGVGAPQTIDQQNLFGGKVRLFVDPGVPSVALAGTWRGVARAVLEGAVGPQPGPTHLNLPFEEPLLGVAGDLPAPVTRTARPVSLDSSEYEASSSRVLVVAGPGTSASTLDACRERRWPVIGDATCRWAIAYADSVLRDDGAARLLAPELVVRTAGLPASKALAERLRQWDIPVVAWTFDGPVADPDEIVTVAATGVTATTVGAVEYLEHWEEASRLAGTVVASVDRADADLTEPAVARAVVGASTRRGTPLVVGSSMPVRDVEWWSPPRTVETFANRGVNGIDGITSTILGIATGATALGYVGDLTFLHDVSGLVDGLGDSGGSCAIVVADNGGGGIFSFLPQAGQLSADRFERLFTTPRRHDLAAIASSFGHRSRRVKTSAELKSSIDEALGREGLDIVVAALPGVAENVEVHAELNREVSRALRYLTP